MLALRGGVPIPRLKGNQGRLRHRCLSRRAGTKPGSGQPSSGGTLAARVLPCRCPEGAIRHTDYIMPSKNAMFLESFVRVTMAFFHEGVYPWWTPMRRI